jgi:6-phosphofructokinase
MIGMQGKPTKHKKIAIAQVGGPTAVINCSLYGFLQEVEVRGGSSCEVFAIQEGMSGLVEGSIFPLKWGTSLDWLRKQPGAALGAGRRVLTPEDTELALAQLRKHDIHSLVLAGGNGTMWAAQQLLLKAKQSGYELHVIGIPKTVDNDIMETDHTPGFPSAAKFVAHAVRDLSADLASMKNFEQIRVVETMGRNVGWLTAAAAYFKEKSEDAPHLIYVPELPFDRNEMIVRVKEIQSQIGYCLVVVSEGLKDNKGQPIMSNGINNSLSNGQGLKALGGVGSHIAEIVSNELGLACRYENLGILQRCASQSVSDQDQMEAEAVGRKAAQLVFREQSGLMVTLIRSEQAEYGWKTGDVPFEKVAGIERSLDPRYIWERGSIADSYREWLRPFIGTSSPYRRFQTKNQLTS